MNTIQSEILNDIMSAKKTIKVAVSWLTDALLIKELINAQQRGVDVRVIMSCNELNIIRFELFQQLQEVGGVVNKEGSEDPEKGGFMHYKFYIIDNTLAKSGSYNWSVNAVTNREALDSVSSTKKMMDFDECFKVSVNFFKGIDNPALKKAELQRIEKENKVTLTPEILTAYRMTQIKMQEQEMRHKKEMDAKEKQRIDAEKAQKLAEENAMLERKERERQMAEQREKERQAQYKQKPDVKVTQVPPTSYGSL